MTICEHNLKHTQMYFEPKRYIITYCALCGKKLSKVDVLENKDFICLQDDIKYDYK